MDFKAFPKISRLRREIIITEKIDGTNGIVAIEHRSLCNIEEMTAKGVPSMSVGADYVMIAGLAISGSD